MTKKVAICIPSGDMVHADFAIALAAMAYQCSPIVRGETKFEAIPLALVNAKGSLIPNNRNKLVAEAKKLGVDYMLFVDTDIVLHPWALRQLLAHDKDIVGATYIQRDEPHRILGRTVAGGLLHEHLLSHQVDTSSLMEVGALPGGCLLVKMSVFDAMAAPYFQTPTRETDGVHWIEGEDYFFCRQACEAGISIWLDWGVSLHTAHVGQRHNRIPAVQVEPEASDAIVH
ncbi:MAG: hypothetical protein ACREJM_15945 [Candidatus Saccharimonadales bacterium]